MRPWIRLFLALVAVALGVLSVWLYRDRLRIACQWRAYSIGVATDAESARAHFAWFESEPDRDEKLRELADAWGRGAAGFDRRLLDYVAGPDSSEMLREACSTEFAWREELLDRWGRYWAWRAGETPTRRAAEIVEYLDLLAASNPPRRLTWREVLDLQAIFALTGRGPLAMRLTPDRWHDRYRNWRASLTTIPPIPPVESPLPAG